MIHCALERNQEKGYTGASTHPRTPRPKATGVRGGRGRRRTDIRKRRACANDRRAQHGTGGASLRSPAAAGTHPTLQRTDPATASSDDRTHDAHTSRRPSRLPTLVSCHPSLTLITLPLTQSCCRVMFPGKGQGELESTFAAACNGLGRQAVVQRKGRAPGVSETPAACGHPPGYCCARGPDQDTMRAT